MADSLGRGPLDSLKGGAKAELRRLFRQNRVLRRARYPLPQRAVAPPWLGDPWSPSCWPMGWSTSSPWPRSGSLRRGGRTRRRDGPMTQGFPYRHCYFRLMATRALYYPSRQMGDK
jgi:hypothetical protein